MTQLTVRQQVSVCGACLSDIPTCHSGTHEEELGSPIINSRRACAARVTVVGLSVCVCVCVSVHDYYRTTGYEAA